MMVTEAVWLRNLLGLPERDTWFDKKEGSLICDAGKTQRLSLRHWKMLDSCCLLLCYYVTDTADNRDEMGEKKGGAAAKEERSGARSTSKDVNKGESKSATTEKSVEVRGSQVDVFV